jgi:hypothetical protein
MTQSDSEDEFLDLEREDEFEDVEAEAEVKSEKVLEKLMAERALPTDLLDEKAAGASRPSPTDQQHEEAAGALSADQQDEDAAGERGKSGSELDAEKTKDSYGSCSCLPYLPEAALAPIIRNFVVRNGFVDTPHPVSLVEWSPLVRAASCPVDILVPLVRLRISTFVRCILTFKKRLTNLGPRRERLAPINRTLDQDHVQNAPASPLCLASLLDTEPDDRTTLLLRCVPLHWYQCNLVKLLEEMGFKGKFNMVYLPMNFRSGENAGYAFVNLVDHATAIKLTEAARGRRLGETLACTEWSNIQGYDGNVEHFRNNSVMHPSVPAFCKPAVYDASGREVAFPPPTKRVTKPRIHWNKEGVKNNEIRAAFATSTAREL